MKRIAALLTTLFLVYGLPAQIESSARSATLAIVDLRSRSTDGWNHCIAKYDNGGSISMDTMSLDKPLGLPAKSSYILDHGEMDIAEFSTLDYFLKNGFELLTISRDSYRLVRFYFKRKTL